MIKYLQQKSHEASNIFFNFLQIKTSNNTESILNQLFTVIFIIFNVLFIITISLGLNHKQEILKSSNVNFNIQNLQNFISENQQLPQTSIASNIVKSNRKSKAKICSLRFLISISLMQKMQKYVFFQTSLNLRQSAIIVLKYKSIEMLVDMSQHALEIHNLLNTKIA